ncbi:MAG: DUF3857 domain-containing protein [Bacteroidales bacterium]|nr:DUF3857 domain-containing protein [Bacteroidales bacterium]
MRLIKTLLLFVLIMQQAILLAQNLPKKFGNITAAEIKMTEYVNDKSAEAVVLFDAGKSHFVLNNSFEVLFEKTKRIKILSEAGLEWAEVEIPYYHEGGAFETIYDLEAYTYNFVNGKITKTKLNTKNCYDEKINRYWMVKKFAFPNVKEGSILEYRYKIKSQYVSQMRDWEFQSQIPVLRSEYEVRMIPFCNYTWLLQGANKFDMQKSYEDRSRKRYFGPPDGRGGNIYHDMVYIFGMKNIPAFKDEEYITSKNDYIIKLDFQLSNLYYLSGAKIDYLTTWPDLIEELSKKDDFGKYLKKSTKLAPKLIDLDAIENKTSEEKFEFILNYVKANYNWDQKNARYTNKSVGDFIKDKHGNSAEINLFTVGLLNAGGVKAFPIWSSTRSHGKIRYNYPYRHFFNYVLIGAQINGEIILSDATEVLCLNNRIPTRCINDRGLPVTTEIEGWTGLQCDFTSEIETNLFINLIDSDIHVKVEKSATEYSAYSFRKSYGDDKEGILESLGEKGYSVSDSSLIVENQYDVKKPYVLKYHVNNIAENINNKVYISPFLNEPFSDNPLKQKTRTYPIDMTYPKKRVYNSNIKIPNGYQVDYLPEDYIIKNDLFELTYKVNKSDIDVNISFVYNFKKSVYSSRDYSKIKFYFNEIVKKGNEKIVLLKI